VIGWAVFAVLYGYFVVMKLLADWLERRYWRK